MTDAAAFTTARPAPRARIGSTPRYHTLDAMRGIAAALVVLRHLDPLCPGLSSGGYLAVDFFFGLSGFVIGKSYEERLRGGLGTGRFLMMRFIRLYPLYALGSLAGACKGIAGTVRGTSGSLPGVDLMTATIFGALMLPAPFGGRSLFPLDLPAWSLFLELIGNLLFAALLVRLRLRGLVGVIAIGAATVVASSVGRGSVDLGADWSTLDGGLARILWSFPVGLLAARFIGHSAPASVLRALIPCILLAIALLAPVPHALRLPVDLAFVLAGGPLLLLLGSRFETPPAFQRLAGWLGDISYPLYAIHMPFVLTVLSVAPHLRIPKALIVLITLAALVAIASILTRFYDKKARNWLSARLGLRPTAQPQEL